MYYYLSFNKRPDEQFINPYLPIVKEELTRKKSQPNAHKQRIYS